MGDSITIGHYGPGDEEEEKKKQPNQYSNGAYASLTARKALALVMLEEGETAPKIAGATGLSETTIYGLKSKGIENAGVPERQLRYMRETRLGRLELVHDSILDHLVSEDGQEKIRKASLRDNTSAMSAILEKIRLLSGESTHRHEVIDDAELVKQYEALKKEVDGMLVEMAPGVDYSSIAEDAEVEEGDEHEGTSD